MLAFKKERGYFSVHRQKLPPGKAGLERMTLTQNWHDIQARTPEVMASLAELHSLHPSSVQDCLDPSHYPKIEKFGDTLFLILRYADTEAPSDADSLLSLTRKMAFFRKDGLLLTVHRGEARFLKDLDPGQDPDRLLLRILKLCIESFKPVIDSTESAIEAIERKIFERKPSRGELLELHRYRSRLSVVKRLMLNTIPVIRECAGFLPGSHAPWVQDLKETSDAQFRIADELMEDVQNLLELQISLASQRTNEVMRFLTVVSLFFLPLTFIVGVYGMNFRFMPELEERWGYPAVWGLMIAVSAFIFLKVRKSGWLSRE